MPAWPPRGALKVRKLLAVFLLSPFQLKSPVAACVCGNKLPTSMANWACACSTRIPATRSDRFCR